VIGFAIAALLATFLLLQAAFRSWRVALLALVALPVALTGGLLAALIDGATLSLGSLVGLLAVLAVAAQGVIVLVKRMQDLQRRRTATGAALVRLAANDRFAPIVTAALATALVMAPFAILGSQAGLEIVHPMSVVILGGLVSATLVTLLVMPVAYVRYAGSEQAEDDDLDVPAGPNGDAAPERETTTAGPRSQPERPPEDAGRKDLAVTESGTEKPRSAD
jgi:Cu/Ag efflux pump CusA